MPSELSDLRRSEFLQRYQRAARFAKFSEALPSKHRRWIIVTEGTTQYGFKNEGKIQLLDA
jgi:hypothetical protein